jgi:DNA-binding NarL/FixJ family response regulator
LQHCVRESQVIDGSDDALEDSRKLSEPELRVLRPLAEGRSIEEVATLLGLSRDDVSARILDAVSKMSVPSASHLLAVVRLRS